MVNWSVKIFANAEYGYVSQCSEMMEGYFNPAILQFDGKILKVWERFYGVHDNGVSPFSVFCSGYPSVDMD